VGVAFSGGELIFARIHALLNRCYLNAQEMCRLLLITALFFRRHLAKNGGYSADCFDWTKWHR
jgi:hypothetical protein